MNPILGPARDLSSGTPGVEEPPLGASIYAASGVINLLALALPITILQIYDRVLPNQSFDTLAVLITALIAVVAIDAILKYLRASLVCWSGASFTHAFSTKALSVMLSSKPNRFSRTMASEHLERLSAGANLGNFVGGQARLIGVDILFIPLFAAVILLVGGVVFFVVLVLFSLFGYLAMRRTQALNTALTERESLETQKHDFIIEVLTTMQTVKSAAMEPLMMRRFERLQSSVSMATRRIITLTGEAQTYSAIYAGLSVVGIVGVGAVLVLQGKLTLGALACCMLLSSQLLQPLMRSLANLNEIELTKHRRERASTIFEEEADGVDAHIEHQTVYRPKRLALRNVSVRYGDGPPLFEALNLDIKPGSLAAIEGPDGSGRSSLLRLFMDDTPVTAGAVIIGDDEDVARSRSAVRYVGQNPTIFRGTILENLTLFGELPASAALEASRLIGLDDEVVRMPMGYDTMLKNAAGRDVPTPMAQRLCLARALSAKPSVLILDEANTLLDLAGEQRLVKALRQLRGDITIVLATHRPSLISMADEAYKIVGRRIQRIAPVESDKGEVVA